LNEINSPTHKRLLLAMPWVILFLFIQLSNESIIQLLVPVMADYYEVTKVKISLIVTIGAILFGIGGTIYSVLTDKFSMKQLFIFGIITFSIGSLVGFLVHPWFMLLVISRVLQCTGAVCATGCYIVLVTRYMPAHMQSKYIALSSAIFLLAAGLGTLIGALISTYLTWKFALLLPVITLVALPSFVKYLPNDKRSGGNLDTVGALLVAVGVLFTILTITLQNYYCLALAIIILLIYYMYAKQHEKPFLDLALLRIRGLKITYLTVFLVFGIQYSILFMLPFIVRDIYMLSMFETGLLFLCANAPALVSAMLTGRLVERFGRRNTFYLGWTLFFISILLFAASIGGPLFMIWFAMFIFAISNPLLYTGMVMAANSLLPEEKLGSGMGVFLLMMGWGNSVFVAVIGLLLTNRIVDVQIMPLNSLFDDASSYSNLFLILAVLFCIVWLLYKYIHGKRE
jgi:DHA2 family metal-tetracycline-proton antiporter-like MFS transporter